MEPTESRAPRVVALTSGGIESAVLVRELLAAGHSVVPCYVEAGLFWEREERQALERFLDALAHERLEPLVVLRMPADDCYKSHWSVTGKGVPDERSPDEAVELPGRNLLLIAKAAAYAAGSGAEAVALGPLKGNPFPDARPAFFKVVTEAIKQAFGRDLAILTPLIHMTKVEVLQHAEGIPLELTFSCISPEDGLHCGKCNKCAERSRGFSRAGLKDPTHYKAQPPKEITQ